MLRFCLISLGIGIILVLIGLAGLVIIPAIIATFGLLAAIIAAVLVFIFVCFILAVVLCI